MNYIVEFQKQNGLNPDGEIGPLTLRKIGAVFNIKSPQRIAHFVGQLATETKSFKSGVESLNYSVIGLKQTFLFFRNNPELAQKYGRIDGVQRADQQAIANLVYDDKNRSAKYKLGNIHPGDGWKFRGHGSIMVTGRRNTEMFFRWMGLPIDSDPELLSTKYFWHTAIWYFEENRLWPICDQMTKGAVRLLTKKINGGDNGLSHRMTLTAMYFQMID